MPDAGAAAIDGWFWTVTAIAVAVATVIGVLLRWFVTRERCKACHDSQDRTIKTLTDALAKEISDLRADHGREIARRPTLHELRDVVSPLYNTTALLVVSMNWTASTVAMLATHDKVEGVVPPEPVEPPRFPGVIGRRDTPYGDGG